MNVGAILLAAGASVRMGGPKQLLQVRGEPLVRRIAKTALRSKVESVVVVLGCRAEEIGPVLEDLPVLLALNGSWEQGLATSIQVGLASLPPATTAALLLTCDQPGLDARVLNRIIKAAGEDALARVACAYGETVGIPALFGRGWFPRFRQLRGDRGAKTLLQGEGVVEVRWEEGARDLDTPEDVARWGIDER
ncbi:MAG: nucleotidyltransferase family protein [Holophagaceae bacterium]|nr:nucleotidyltransferase family protein [Holophagaceae bacterium]